MGCDKTVWMIIFGQVSVCTFLADRYNLVRSECVCVCVCSCCVCGCVCVCVYVCVHPCVLSCVFESLSLKYMYHMCKRICMGLELLQIVLCFFLPHIPVWSWFRWTRSHEGERICGAVGEDNWWVQHGHGANATVTTAASDSTLCQGAAFQATGKLKETAYLVIR